MMVCLLALPLVEVRIVQNHVRASRTCSLNLARKLSSENIVFQLLGEDEQIIRKYKRTLSY